MTLNALAATSVSTQLSAALAAGAGAEIAGGENLGLKQIAKTCVFSGSISLSGEEYVAAVIAFIESLKLDLAGSQALRLSYSITSVTTTLTEEQVKVQVLLVLHHKYSSTQVLHHKCHHLSHRRAGKSLLGFQLIAR